LSRWFISFIDACVVLFVMLFYVGLHRCILHISTADYHDLM